MKHVRVARALCLVHDVSLVSGGAAGGARAQHARARARTDTHEQARADRLDLSWISSRVSADGSLSCLTWTRGQLRHHLLLLLLHHLAQLCRGAASAWRSELLDSHTLAALRSSGCCGDTWMCGGTADDDAAAALRRPQTALRIVAIVGFVGREAADHPGAAWRSPGRPESSPGSCCCSPTWRESVLACRTCSDSVSLLSLICFSRARQTLTERVCVCACSFYRYCHACGGVRGN